MVKTFLDLGAKMIGIEHYHMPFHMTDFGDPIMTS